METENGFKPFKMHWHDYMELILVTQGSILLTFDNQNRLTEAGNLAIIPPKQLHAGTPGEDGVKIYSIFLDIAVISNKALTTDLFLKPLLDGKSNFISVTSQPEILQAVQELIIAKKQHNILFTQGKIYELIALLFQFAHTGNQNIHSIKMQKIFDYIQLHYLEGITAKNLSAEFGYTESHFCHLFKQYVGIPLSKYILLLKIEKAKKLLQETNIDINKVAEMCGFLDFSYFCLCFKKHVNKTPSAFRKAMNMKANSNI